MHFDLDVVHRRTAALDWSEIITCPSCGMKSKASVKVKGTGHGRAHYGIGDEDARDRAGVDAFATASSAGEALLRRAKCPHCGKRGDRVTSLVVQSVLVAVVVGVVAARLLPEAGVLVGALVGLALPPVLIWSGLTAADRVRFEPVFDVPAHLVGGDKQHLLEVAPQPSTPEQPRVRRDDPALDFERSWQAPGADVPARAPEAGSHGASWQGQVRGVDGPMHEPQLGGGDELELELDLDRAWNKKG